MTYEDECITNVGVNLITIPNEICAPIAGSVFAGVCFGWMTANIKVGVDVGLAALLVLIIILYSFNISYEK